MRLPTRSLKTALAAALCLAAAASDAASLRVVSTLPDLGDLVREVGGDAVAVTAFARGREDPHFIEARPSFIRVLSRAHLLVYNGLDLEIGWLPPLVRSARNGRIRSGEPGDFDASAFVPRLQVLTGPVDRSQGDVHARGNPHYLLDPLNGLRVARELRDRLVALAPEQAAGFASRYDDFERRLWIALVGETWVATHGMQALTSAVITEEFDALVRDAPSDEAPSGWLGTMASFRGRPVVADHNLWPYFEHRFGIRIVGFLEPIPGITPSSRHLTELSARMKRDGISLILAASYFHPRYAEKLAGASGARVVEMANQVGAREGVDSYLAMTDWNVRVLSDALRR